MEFFEVIKEIKEIRKDISVSLKKAQDSLSRAQAMGGITEVEQIAQSLSKEAHMEVVEKSIMGVKIPEITNIKTNDEWFSYLSGSIELDSSVKKYREAFPTFMKLVEKQIALNRIAEDIKRTRRKVNSLEYIIVPRLEKAKSLIAFKLEEQERENFTRLKKLKK
jgi:V/A-type H+-transporting ATPase subunit D